MSVSAPGGCAGSWFERVEVVVDGLDLGTLEHVEAHAEEHVLDQPARGREQVQPADRDGRLAGQRDVDAVGGQALGQLGGLELGPARVDQRLQRLARLVGCLAHPAALLRRQLGDAPQQVGQLGLRPR